MDINRRHFTLLAAAFAFSGLAKCTNAREQNMSQIVKGYGDLIPDPDGLLDLPKGFSYEIISAFGETMDDGLKVPDAADGMGCIPLSDTSVALIRNHELRVNKYEEGPQTETVSKITKAFDFIEDDDLALPGGTSTLIYDLEQNKVTRQFLSLSGTIRNCAGGVTPWGSWLTCEEDVTKAGDGVTKDHGWVFEVPASSETLIDPVPLKDLGRFNHEATAVDPETGIVYMTEDRDDSLFYRFIPDTYGKLNEGGRLQALGFKDTSIPSDSRNSDTLVWKTGDWQDAIWIDLEDTHSPEDDLRNRGHAKGAVIFARGEGIHWGDDELYFCCTSGGEAGLGQIMRYKPSRDQGLENKGASTGKIQLFLESTDPTHFNFGDNLTIASNGHLFVCEDQYSFLPENHIRGVTNSGAIYDFARIRVDTEPAGACFSPDGSILFVNLYSPAKTLAIKGPWASVSEQA
ncbi:alkaline phosphatase PhoX [Kordiimonas sp. SCSIO 12610]|uniref:alkaline phosphatase PhoX n=1 Tax=Kordiimonas sp. SCSIO 12610 TaxID=2829597 RepID=UPI00210AEB50|nr:alkaline phosphatase PhoX [Kordiimonas sp. SCSIO 12610]UTW54360.1 DUF839 domain-containing protein [Kordiimonas sp. SCSIO 12610]